MNKIYFAIEMFFTEDKKDHFELKGVYFSEEDLLKDFDKIRSYNYFIYSAEDSCVIDDLKHLTKHTTKEFADKLEILKEEEEYKEYLRLKRKFKHRG